MKKKWILPVVLCLLAAAIFILGRRPVEDAVPPMLKVDGKLYRCVEVSEGGPSSRPEGVLTEYIGDRIPEADGEYNFDAEEVPYWKHSQGICVYVKESGNYLLFEEVQIQE